MLTHAIVRSRKWGPPNPEGRGQGYGRVGPRAGESRDLCAKGPSVSSPSDLAFHFTGFTKECRLCMLFMPRIPNQTFYSI